MTPPCSAGFAGMPSCVCTAAHTSGGHPRSIVHSNHSRAAAQGGRATPSRNDSMFTPATVTPESLGEFSVACDPPAHVKTSGRTTCCAWQGACSPPGGHGPGRQPPG